jgi:hypothetical protein
MIQIFGGIDNGITGSIGILSSLDIPYSFPLFCKTPTKSELSYTKEKQNITRIDAPKLTDYFLEHLPVACRPNTLFLFERPLTGGFSTKALNSAMRSMEATLIVLELLQIPYAYIDSKEWQKELLPGGLKGTDALKLASRDVGIRRFPQFKELIQKHKDADGILIAEYCRMKYK